MAKKSNIPLTKNSSVLFVTFSRWDNGKRTPTNGSLDPLRDFLVPKIKKLVIIDQPHPSGEGVMPIIEKYKNHDKDYKSFTSSWWMYILKPWLSLSHANPHGTYIRFKIRDFMSVLDWSMRDKTVYDYCICLESINTLAAILLKKMGKVKKVVYYVSDYSPKRYPNKLFNSVYLALDRYCAVNADYIWDVSPAMQKARVEKGGLDLNKSAPVINVPNGLYPGQIKANPVSQIQKHALVYMGIVSADNGPDIAIKSLKLVKKKYPDAVLHMIGGSDNDFMWLSKIVNKLKLEKSIVRHGFIKSGTEMSAIIRSCAIGLAPYRAIPGSIRYYADAGKIRAYCAAGIPVVSSQVPPLGQVVAGVGAAIIANDDPESFADAVCTIFASKKFYFKLRQKAITFGEHNTWDNTFKNAFSQMNK